MTATHAQRTALGAYGERLAARFLVDSGLVVLDRNWRCRDGEIDIVAGDGDELVVCEVKARSSTRFGTPLEAITPQKADRLYRLGQRWLAAHDVTFVSVRVDVVCVMVGTGRARLEHLRAVA
jgi:putative endonuclease